MQPSVWLQVSAGVHHTCGIRTGGTVGCWGDNQYGQASPPPGTFESISAGGFHTCGIRTGGTVECWGYNYYRQLDVPSNTFESISAGNWHTCGIRAGGTVECWGWNSYHQLDVPSDTFESISAGSLHTCGIRTGGTVACWGWNGDGQLDAPSDTFESISAGVWHTCGIRAGGTVECWGRQSEGQATPPSDTFDSVSAGDFHTCGIRTDDTVICWGRNGEGQLDAPSDTFDSVSANNFYNCGIRTDATVACWGINDSGQTAPPSDVFKSINTGGASGGYYNCGIRPGGTVECWGRGSSGEMDAPPGTFEVVSASESHTCGIRTEGTVACWGSNSQGKANPPEGTFEVVSAGESHTCGIRTDGTVACWGDNTYGQIDTPSGTFVSVTAGNKHTCGVRTGGTVQCWGDNYNGQTTPPSGTFESVSAGALHTCGIRTDGTVACWGDNEYGQINTPQGAFESISAAYYHTCGIRTDGMFRCWGKMAAIEEPLDVVVPTVPDKPAMPEAIAGNAQVAVSWTAPFNGGSPISSYIVTSSPGGKTCWVASVSCTIEGLTNGTAYTFTVKAINRNGNSPDSDPSDPVTPTAVPASPPAKPAKPAATAGDAKATVTWTAPANGGSPITGYTVTSDPEGKTCTTGGLTCTVTGLTNGTAYTFTVEAANAVGISPASDPSDPVTPTDASAPAPTPTYFHPISPTRLIDPRPAWKVGPFNAPWTKGLARDVQVTGEAGIPSGAKAVVLNVTVTDVTSPIGTFISVYPAGGTRPNVSSLNAASGQTIANSVTTKIGDGGKITIYNDQGSANVIVDIAGYYTEGSGDGYAALSPTRVIDSRPTWQHGPYSSPWSAGQSRDVTVDTSAGVPSGANAVVLNITATDVTQGTFISVYPKGTTRPNASNLNLAAGNTIANQVVVKLGTADRISVYNEAGKANVIVDVVGYYASGSGDAFYPVAPQRIIDPRPSWKVGPFSTPWGNQVTREVQVTGGAGVPASATAVATNVTATDVTQGTFVTVFPGGSVPTASNLNAATGWTIANAVTAKLSASGKISVYNEKPTANIIVDVNGYFGGGSPLGG